MTGCGWFFRLSGFAMTSPTCFFNTSCIRERSAVLGERMIASRVGIEKMIVQKNGKLLIMLNDLVAACIAVIRGVMKLGPSIALADLAKQKLVIVSIVNARKAKNISTDVSLSALFFASAATRRST